MQNECRAMWIAVTLFPRCIREATVIPNGSGSLINEALRLNLNDGVKLNRYRSKPVSTTTNIKE
jgi:hypothetical protein